MDLFAPVGVAFPQNCLAASSRSVLSCLGQSQRATLALTVAATIGGSQIDDISIRVLGSQTARKQEGFGFIAVVGGDDDI